MPWTPLYNDLNYSDFLGNSLSTFNGNFDSIDTYLEGLSSVLVNGLLLKTNNLSDVTSMPSATANLGFGTIAPLNEKSCAQASVVFNGKSWTTVSGENRCNIISSYNVDKVVRVSSGEYKIYYSNTLEYIGAVVGTSSSGYFMVNYATSKAPTTQYCTVVTNDSESSNVNVIIY